MLSNFRSFLQCSVGYGVKFENSGCSRSFDVSVGHYFYGCSKFLKTDGVKIEQSFASPTSIPGGDRQIRADFFIQNSISNKLYSNISLMGCVFLASLSPKWNVFCHF